MSSSLIMEVFNVLVQKHNFAELHFYMHVFNVPLFLPTLSDSHKFKNIQSVAFASMFFIMLVACSRMAVSVSLSPTFTQTNISHYGMNC